MTENTRDKTALETHSQIYDRSEIMRKMRPAAGRPFELNAIFVFFFFFFLSVGIIWISAKEGISDYSVLVSTVDHF